MEMNKGYIIAYKSLGVGSYDYSFKVDSELFSYFESPEITAGNCDVTVQLQRGDAMLSLLVEIKGEVVVACDRCLEPCPIEIAYQGNLIVKFSTEVDDYDGEILWIDPAQGEVDLSQYIYESIVLSLPYQRVHPEGECNEEMIGRLGLSSEVEWQEEVDEEAEEAGEEEETHGLAVGDLAKLQALKEAMEKR